MNFHSILVVLEDFFPKSDGVVDPVITYSPPLGHSRISQGEL
jgi:hypothetical protein